MNRNQRSSAIIRSWGAVLRQDPGGLSVKYSIIKLPPVRFKFDLVFHSEL